MVARKNNKNNTNKNGFSVRFGMQRRHRGSPFALSYHQFIKLVTIQDEGVGGSGCTSRVGYLKTL